MNFEANYETKVRSIRGAITVDSNCESDIQAASVELYREMIERNSAAEIESVIHCVISTTADITASYPAKAVREYGCTAPLFSCQEPSIEGALPMCIRILLTVYCVNPVRHAYLKGADVLRPDIK